LGWRGKYSGGGMEMAERDFAEDWGIYKVNGGFIKRMGDL